MNSQETEVKRFVIDRVQLPEFFPTNRHPAQFWEHFGRAVGTFGFLEEMLKKAIFAFTASRRYDSTEEAEDDYKKWLPALQCALKSPLSSLAEQFEKAVRENPDSMNFDVGELVKDIKNAAKVRNVLCHGSWRAPDKAGKSLPLFINNRNEKFETTIDLEFLYAVQRHVAELSCRVVDSVTLMGLQFPGSSGPGKTIWPQA